jgi:cytochrome bd-type quinol oxidase subunit 2
MDLVKTQQALMIGWCLLWTVDLLAQRWRRPYVRLAACIAGLVLAVNVTVLGLLRFFGPARPSVPWLYVFVCVTVFAVWDVVLATRALREWERASVRADDDRTRIGTGG